VGKKVLIVGANFENKGAQAMLFIAIDEIKKRIGNCEIYFAGMEMLEEELYAFKQMYYSKDAKLIALETKLPIKIIAKCFLKDCIKFVIGRHRNLWKFMDVYKLLPEVDLVIDVSGFNLGDKWSTEIHQEYLNNIRLAHKYNIPIILMPQSFGPFCYKKENKFLLEEMEQVLPYAKIIYAREQSGKQMLMEEIHLKNVELSTDLVLQNSGIDFANIYKKDLKIEIPGIEKNSVGIVPNIQCFNHGNREKNLAIYKAIINELLKRGKSIYIFRHSKEDYEICKLIASCFDGNKLVKLIEKEFSCLEYDQFVKGFEFIVCSRYHGIVHAYRNYIPCLAMGWAVKYSELAQNVCQSEYVFDITADNCTEETVIKAMQALICNLQFEKNVIREQIVRIQRDNCFNCISEWMEQNE